MMEQFMKDCLSWEELHTRAGEKCKEEGVADTKHCELTTTPILHPPFTDRRAGKRWKI